MTDMVRLTNVAHAVLPPEGQTYQTSDDWYTALAEMHIAQLAFQHNDAVASEDDCRNKYVARMVFRRLAKQGRLSTFGFKEDDWSAQSSKLGDSVTCPAPSNSESFHLWGDDFRAGNILLDAEDNLAALIDWEYTYAAPTQFVLDPPWWLLIETIEMWSHGPDTWCGIYEDRLPTWFSAMEKAEAESDAPSPFPLPLSVYMRESWKTGRFFLSYGARKCWAFDMAYWRYLHERFFGTRPDNVTKNDLWRTMIDLLNEDERAAMEPFVNRKMEESRDRRIVDWEANEAKSYFSSLLFD